MTTDRRQQVLRLYHMVLAREADDRDAFLAQACAGDRDLERDVRAILALDPPEDFLESPAILEAERPFAPFAHRTAGGRVSRPLPARIRWHG
jgi:hypothetical protein